MSMHRSLFTLVILFLPCLLFSQQVKPSVDLSKADSLAFTVKYNGDINALTKELTTPSRTKYLK